MGKRDTEVAEGGDSIVAFERYLETGDRSLLESIERYNEDDCRSTHLLREWLLARRDEAIETFGQEIPWRAAARAVGAGPRAPGGARRAARRAHRRRPRRRGDRDDDQRAHWLMAQLIDYHRREAKPGVVGVLRTSRSRRGAADGGRQRGARETHRCRRRADPAPPAFALGASTRCASPPRSTRSRRQLRRSRDREGSDGRVDRQRDRNAADQPCGHACRRAASRARSSRAARMTPATSVPRCVDSPATSSSADSTRSRALQRAAPDPAR